MTSLRERRRRERTWDSTIRRAEVEGGWGVRAGDGDGAGNRDGVEALEEVDGEEVS